MGAPILLPDIENPKLRSEEPIFSHTLLYEVGSGACKANEIIKHQKLGKRTLVSMVRLLLGTPVIQRDVMIALPQVSSIG